MHATIQKPFQEILGMLEGENKVFIIGCGNCATKCKSGGKDQVEEMKRRLEEVGKIVTGTTVPDSGCSLPMLKDVVTENLSAFDESDSVIVLACGQGVHTAIDASGKITHPGCNTIFGGETLQPGVIHEYCVLCGECIVEHTGGLCPLALCTKGLLNGPCGGAVDGKCEVDRERDCGWNLIYRRLEDIGKVENIYGYIEPKTIPEQAGLEAWQSKRKCQYSDSKARPIRQWDNYKG